MLSSTNAEHGAQVITNWIGLTVYEDDDDYLVPCPKCGKEIYEDVDQCPYCREFLSSSDFKKQTPAWVVVIVVLTIVSFLLASIYF